MFLCYCSFCNEIARNYSRSTCNVKMAWFSSEALAAFILNQAKTLEKDGIWDGCKITNANLTSPVVRIVCIHWSFSHFHLSSVSLSFSVLGCGSPMWRRCGGLLCWQRTTNMAMPPCSSYWTMRRWGRWECWVGRKGTPSHGMKCNPSYLFVFSPSSSICCSLSLLLPQTFKSTAFSLVVIGFSHQHSPQISPHCKDALRSFVNV